MTNVFSLDGKFEKRPFRSYSAEDFPLPISLEAWVETYSNHPFMIDEQLLQTKSALAVLEAVEKAVDNRRSGIGFYSPPRYGKTQAMYIVELLLARRKPNVPIITIEAFESDVVNENTMWRQTLASLGVQTTGRATTGDLRGKMVSLVQNQFQSIKGPRVALMLIDEAQNWTVREWRVLKGFMNMLRKSPLNIRLVVVLFAQTAILSRREELKRLSDRSEDLVDRFMRDLREFPPLDDVGEIMSIFEQFDNPEFDDFPDESGICYSQFFLPKAYAAGWRLSTSSKFVYELLKKKANSMRMPLRIMTLMLAVRAFFREVDDVPNFNPTYKMWKDVLERAVEAGDL